jgi:hypothetical protein
MENDKERIKNLTEQLERYEQTIQKISLLTESSFIRSFDLKRILIKAQFLPKLKYDPNKNYRYTPTSDIYDI